MLETLATMTTSRRLTNSDFPPGLLGNGQELFIPQPGPIARSVADVTLAMTSEVFQKGVSFKQVPPSFLESVCVLTADSQEMQGK